MVGPVMNTLCLWKCPVPVVIDIVKLLIISSRYLLCNISRMSQMVSLCFVFEKHSTWIEFYERGCETCYCALAVRIATEMFFKHQFLLILSPNRTSTFESKMFTLANCKSFAYSEWFIEICRMTCRKYRLIESMIIMPN